MDRADFDAFDRTGLVHRLADHIHDAAERAGTDRDGNGLPGIGYFLAAHQTLARIHRDGADRRFAEMLGDFEHQTMALVLRFQGIEDRGQMILEVHVDHGADDLGDASDGLGHNLNPCSHLKFSPLKGEELFS